MKAAIRTGALRGYCELVRELGGRPEPLLRRYRITARSLAQEDSLIPVRSHVRLLEHTVQVLDCADFGLRLGARQDTRILGSLGLAMQSFTTLRDALLGVAKRIFVHSQSVVLTIVPHSPVVAGTSEIRIALAETGLASQRQFIDQCLAAMNRFAEALAGGPSGLGLRMVLLDHAPLAPLSEYRRIFGVPVRASQPYSALLVDQRVLDARLPDTDRSLGRLALEYIDNLFDQPGQTVAARVRAIVSQSLGTTPIGRERVAATMAVHPRTLQRQLADEGTSFHAIYDAVQKQAASRYLHNTALCFGQIATRVGLSQGSALTRSCLRWFGRTPSQLRSDSTRGRASANRS